MTETILIGENEFTVDDNGEYMGKMMIWGRVTDVFLTLEEKTEEVVKEEAPKKSGVITETTITWEAPETKVDTKVEEPKKPEVNKTEPKVEEPVKPSVDEITKEEPQKDEEITPTTPNVAKQITVPNKPFSYPLLKTGRLANTGITDTNSLYAGLAFFGLASLLIYRRKKA